jgi:adenylate cyclase class IV
MYETEIKVEIPASQLEGLLATCRKRGFTDNDTALQRDYYTKAVQSSYGGPKAFDVERYRSESGHFFYTKKEWEVEHGTPARKEEEREITQSEFEVAIAKHSDALKIAKYRHSFGAFYEDRGISLSIDSVKFDHSPAVRHFVEPEILVAEKAMVPTTREFLRRFIADLLGISAFEVIEAAGMFAMAFKKL